MRGIRHVALFSTALEAAERFWVDVMGYVVEWRPDPDNVYLTSGTDNLALHRQPPDAGGPVGQERQERQERRERLDHVGLAVPAPSDVDAWAEHLAANAVKLRQPPRTHRDGSRSLYFETPDGVLVQIIYHQPLSQ